MTTKIVWRLKEQPTSESLRELVKDKILTNEEAREILFSSQEETKRDVESLETEIKFLRDLVEKLSQNSSQVVETIKIVEIPYKQYSWYNPYTIWCSSGTSNIYSATNSSNGCSFSSIQTF